MKLWRSVCDARILAVHVEKVPFLTHQFANAVLEDAPAERSRAVAGGETVARRLLALPGRDKPHINEGVEVIVEAIRFDVERGLAFRRTVGPSVSRERLLTPNPFSGGWSPLERHGEPQANHASENEQSDEDCNPLWGGE